MKLEELIDTWDRLELSIQRVIVSQPSSMTKNAERMDNDRRLFGTALRDFSRSPVGRRALQDGGKV